MEKELPDEPRTDDGVIDEAPVVVLPSPNAQGVAGNLQGTAASIPAISPQPFIAPLSTTREDGLASRLEAALAEDGRFLALLPDLVIQTADDGAVHLSGTIPSEAQRHSLLSAVRDVPGVTNVEDALSVE